MRKQCNGASQDCQRQCSAGGGKKIQHNWNPCCRDKTERKKQDRRQRLVQLWPPEPSRSSCYDPYATKRDPMIERHNIDQQSTSPDYPRQQRRDEFALV